MDGCAGPGSPVGRDGSGPLSQSLHLTEDPDLKFCLHVHS